MTDFLTGVYNITPTPFADDGSLDLDSLKRLTVFTRDKGVHGMTILGVLGEADKLTESERDRVIATAVEAAGSGFPICVGTTHAGTDGCIAYSRRAQELGARAVMVAPPKLARANDAALERHYLAVAEALDIPVVVQDFPPSVGGILMSVEVIARIGAASPRCRYLKLEDEPSPMKVSQVRKANPDIRVLGGLGGMMFLEELRHGAHGTMTGFGYPEILVDIYTRYTAGDIDGATEVFYRYLPLIRFENQPRINLALRKDIYQRRGAIASPRVRAPFTPVDAETLADLDRHSPVQFRTASLMDLGLKGRRALVLAASRGLGYACGAGSHRKAATWSMCSRDEPRIQAAAEQIRSDTGVRVAAQSRRTSAAPRRPSAGRRGVAAYGGLEIVVHNAGGPPAGEFPAMTEAQWAKAFEQNLMSFVRIVHAAVPGDEDAPAAAAS